MLNANFTNEAKEEIGLARHRSPTGGFTLVELLIGLFLNLFIVGVTLTYFVSSSQTFRAQNDQDMIQENARYTLEVLSRNIRLAGLNAQDSLGATEMQVIYYDNNCPGSATGATASTTNESPCTDDLKSGNPAINQSDRFAIDYISTSNKGCNNTIVGINHHVASVFWVADPDGNGVSSLYCQAMNVGGTYVGTATPLIEGVDALQVQYGVDTDGDNVINTYQSFTQFSSNSDTVTQDIKAIRLALLLSSGVSVKADQNIQESITKTYTLLDGAPLIFENDRIIRQIFSTTIMLPNTS